MARGWRETEARQAARPLEFDWMWAVVGQGEGDLTSLSHCTTAKVEAVFMGSWRKGKDFWSARVL